PGHVAWLILNYQVFGAHPFGWHVTNLLAHLGVVTCIFLFLRKLSVTLGLAAAIVAIFAVHPTRVESVTWIAGVHDVLSALWQLCALLCLLSIWLETRSQSTAFRWCAAVALYALAVCTKEIATFFPISVA